MQIYSQHLNAFFQSPVKVQFQFYHGFIAWDKATFLLQLTDVQDEMINLLYLIHLLLKLNFWNGDLSWNKLATSEAVKFNACITRHKQKAMQNLARTSQVGEGSRNLASYFDSRIYLNPSSNTALYISEINSIKK